MEIKLLEAEYGKTISFDDGLTKNCDPGVQPTAIFTFAEHL
jgi:hypothetical protein